MKIGIPKESKVLEGRVALIPEACASLIRQGNDLFIESGAGELSGYKDEQYIAQGVVIKPNAAELFATACLIVKVKDRTTQVPGAIMIIIIMMMTMMAMILLVAMVLMVWAVVTCAAQATA